MTKQLPYPHSTLTKKMLCICFDDFFFLFAYQAELARKLKETLHCFQYYLMVWWWAAVWNNMVDGPWQWLFFIF
jgi:hypothetical protein